MGLRIFSVDGKKATFNKEAFKHFLRQKSHQKKVSIAKLEQELAEDLTIAANTVHKWNYNGGGPIDYSTIERLAELLDVPDASRLLKFIDEGENIMAHLTERQLAAVKRIYDICIWFLREFYNTTGFNDYWPDFHNKGSKNPEEDIYQFVEGMHEKVRLVLEQEYFDLRNCEIYNELYKFVDEELNEIYDGKLSYGYRFEARSEGNPTTAEDYDKAMIQLNTIIDKYT